MELGVDDYWHKGINFDAFVAAAKSVCERLAATL
jgi:hypothetical protein